jgi:Zn-dependent protease
MGDPAEDPVDHHRTFLPHAGEAVKNTAGRPGLIAIGIAVFAVMVSIASFGTGRTTLGIVAAVLAAIGFVFGLAWIARQRKRVLRDETSLAQRTRNPTARRIVP